ncbi:MAG: hypothetical protein Q9178_005484 [Gyalolechia marmorata]
MRKSGKQIEDYPAGLPRFANLLGSAPAFVISRRFSVARSRLLLLKQDRVSILEARLNETDQNEERPLFLGCSRLDANTERANILHDLDNALADLDAFVLRSNQISSLPAAAKPIIDSLNNWVDGTGCLSRQQTAYLAFEDDLITTNSYNDYSFAFLQPKIEMLAIWLYQYFKKHPGTAGFRASRDKHVFIFPEDTLKRITRMVIAWLTVATIPVPILIVHALRTPGSRVAFTMVALTLLIVVGTCLSGARTTEIFIAGAT